MHRTRHQYQPTQYEENWIVQREMSQMICNSYQKKHPSPHEEKKYRNNWKNQAVHTNAIQKSAYL